MGQGRRAQAQPRARPPAAGSGRRGGARSPIPPFQPQRRLVPFLSSSSSSSSSEGGRALRSTMETASHSLILLQQLNMQREFGFLCDCTVAIGDVYFKAHRAVLAAFSNYFKMIFIHQTSECIKIQPTDIQPDIFSYLLHIMYTGKGPKQMVNHARLEEGIRFLHADYLSRMAVEMNQMLSPEAVPSSNLYGIQISTTHKTVHESLQAKESLTSLGSRTANQGDHPQLQLSLAIGLDDGSLDQQISHPSVQAGAKPSEETASPPVTIKQEQAETEPVVSQSHTSSSPDVRGPFISKTKIHLCQYCGEHFESRSNLREHLFTHVSGSLPFGVPASILESSDLSELQPVNDSHQAVESHRLGPFLQRENERQSEHPSRSSLESLPIGQLSLVSKDSEPMELNCNFSFSRKRKVSCTVCGHKFLRKSQLLEHMYAHKGKHFKFGRCQRLGGAVTSKFQPYSENWTQSVAKSATLSQAHVDSQTILDPDLSQENIDTILVE